MFHKEDKKKVMSFELYLEPERPVRNRKTGRYMKGCVPFNKGLSWSEYMPKDSQERAKKGWSNITPGVCYCAGWNRKAVAMYKDGIYVCSFRSMSEAARKTGLSLSSIERNVKNGKHSVHGFTFVRDYHL